jgi:predicted metalloprotease with PDZ domain
MKTGPVKHGWTGVFVTEKVPNENQGVVISQFFENSPAIGCGLKVGDQVVRIGKREISRPSDVIDVSFFSKVGYDLPVEVLPMGKTALFSKCGSAPRSRRSMSPQRNLIVPIEVACRPSDAADEPQGSIRKANCCRLARWRFKKTPTSSAITFTFLT